MLASLLWALALPVLAQVPNYDSLSDKDGNITARQRGRELIALAQKAGAEAIYADASKGNPRAGRVFQALEADHFPGHGRELADLVRRAPCPQGAILLREQSGWCVPDWAFLDSLGKDRPGGARLRKALFDGYAERARQRGLDGQLVLSAMNALLGFEVTVARPPGPHAELTPNGLQHIIDRHWPTSGAKGAGKFAAGTTGESLRVLIDEAVAKGKSRPNTQGRPGQIFEYDFGRKIGVDLFGAPTSKLRVVVSPAQEVVTAFPY